MLGFQQLCLHKVREKRRESNSDFNDRQKLNRARDRELGLEETRGLLKRLLKQRAAGQDAC